MRDALRERSLEKPGLYQDEMAVFQCYCQHFQVSTGLLASMGWIKKAARHLAKERNADLRDFNLYSLSAFRSYHLVFVDESGSDQRVGFGRTGWSPLEVTPAQVTLFHPLPILG